MARARNIKPGFFKNELLSDLSAFDRILFIGLWCLADREGRLENRPKRIKGELFAWDDYKVEDGITRLLNSKFIKTYSFNEFNIIQIVNFIKHQKPHGTEKDSYLPDENGMMTVHERNKNGCVTGNKQQYQIDIKEEIKNNCYLTVKEQFPNALNVECGKMNHECGKMNEDTHPEIQNPVAVAPKFSVKEVLLSKGVCLEIANDWIEHRKKKRAVITDRVIKSHEVEAAKSGISLEMALEICIVKGWNAYDSSYGKTRDPPKKDPGKHGGFDDKDYGENELL